MSTLVQQPTDYINFLIYCKKRKSFCKGYHQSKKAWLNGQIGYNDYVRALRKIHNAALELELRYFDILYMRQ